MTAEFHNVNAKLEYLLNNNIYSKQLSVSMQIIQDASKREFMHDEQTGFVN